MNEKITLQDIVNLLCEKQGISPKEAETFVRAMFDLIEEALANEKYVKIKGLGTFKLTEVNSRESVHVNTGERIEIQGHSKVSFTPDTSMKELINKPFSHFETVVLNEGVELEDTIVENETPEATEITETVVAIEESVMAPIEDVTPTEEPVIDEPIIETPTTEEPIHEELVAEEVIVEEVVVEESIIEQPNMEESTQEEPETIVFVGTDGGSPVIKVTLDVEAGCEYMLGRPSGTVDLYWAELTCQVEKSDVVGFDIVSEGTVDYLVGDAYDSSKMSINAVYANGRTEVITLDDENLTIDYSKVDTSKAGVYQVSVQYKEYEAKTIDVAVYDVTELELGFNAIEKIANSSAGNGVYFNQTVQRIYLKNAEALDPSYLTVSAIAKHPVDASKSMVFVLSASEYSLSALEPEALSSS